MIIPPKHLGISTHKSLPRPRPGYIDQFDTLHFSDKHNHNK